MERTAYPGASIGSWLGAASRSLVRVGSAIAAGRSKKVRQKRTVAAQTRVARAM
jgi:hypothetical protein